MGRIRASSQPPAVNGSAPAESNAQSGDISSAGETHHSTLKE